jgi:hypothetical protein
MGAGQDPDERPDEGKQRGGHQRDLLGQRAGSADMDITLGRQSGQMV